MIVECKTLVYAPDNFTQAISQANKPISLTYKAASYINHY